MANKAVSAHEAVLPNAGGEDVLPIRSPFQGWGRVAGDSRQRGMIVAHPTYFHQTHLANRSARNPDFACFRPSSVLDSDSIAPIVSPARSTLPSRESTF